MEATMEMIAYCGSILLALCGVPMAWKSYKDGHSKGVDGYFLGTWFTGEILLLIYALYLGDLPLILNYGLNLIFIYIAIFYKIKPRV